MAREEVTSRRDGCEAFCWIGDSKTSAYRWKSLRPLTVRSKAPRGWDSYVFGQARERSLNHSLADPRFDTISRHKRPCTRGMALVAASTTFRGRARRLPLALAFRSPHLRFISRDSF